MRILITGGFGFVGGRLAVHLAQAGHQVMLGSRNASHPPNWLLQAEVVRTDWKDGRALEQVCIGVDVVIHAAGMNAQECAADPIAALEFNGLATVRLVSAASRANVKRFIYLSTAHVYVSPLVGAITEDTCPRNLHPYATSHLAGEQAVQYATQRKQVDGCVLRLSNAFGAPAHKEADCWMLLVNDLCRQAVETGKMVLHSSGLQLRDFVPLASVCAIVNELLVHQKISDLGGVINVGSGNAISILAMAETIQARCGGILGFTPAIEHPDGKQGETVSILEYKTTRLDKLGLTNHVALTSEIDGCLQFCLTHFVSADK